MWCAHALTVVEWKKVSVQTHTVSAIVTINIPRRTECNNLQTPFPTVIRYTHFLSPSPSPSLNDWSVSQGRAMPNFLGEALYKMQSKALFN